MLNYIEVPDEGNSLIEPGIYHVNVSDCVVTKASTGTQGLQLEVTIGDGKYENRKAWHTIWHTKPDGSPIGMGMRQVKEFCLACGIEPTEFKEANQVLGSNIKAKIGVEKGQNGYKDRNKIERFMPQGRDTGVAVPKSDSFEPKQESWM